MDWDFSTIYNSAVRRELKRLKEMTLEEGCLSFIELSKKHRESANAFLESERQARIERIERAKTTRPKLNHTPPEHFKVMHK